jgi:uncharacterized protein (DUF1697 family)
MTRYVALLRAVNVGGRNAVAMADLRAWFEDLGFQNPRTLLNSGNIVFEAATLSIERLEVKLEADARKALKIETPFLVRTGEDLARVVARNPFPKEASSDPGHLLVVFAKANLAAANVKSLEEAIVGRERVRADGRHLYAVYPDGAGRSKLTAALIDKKLGCAGTARNWNTVIKLKELACLP